MLGEDVWGHCDLPIARTLVLQTISNCQSADRLHMYEKQSNLVGSELDCRFGHHFQNIQTVAYT